MGQATAHMADKGVRRPEELIGQPGARILEQLNMPREAIQALEDAGLIHEAAKILMRMQRANRAGVIYARHAMWDNAAQCFKLANMPLEVAKCYREAGNLPLAAEYFVGDPDAVALADTVLPADLSPDESREAVRALRGKPLGGK